MSRVVKAVVEYNDGGYLIYANNYCGAYTRGKTKEDCIGMKRTEQALNMIVEGIKGKKVLEVACGCAELSIEAASVADEIHCIDIDKFRLLPEVEGHVNIFFRQMDATKMIYEDGYFDSCVMYNAIGHLTNSMEEILKECVRVTVPNGNIYVISSFKTDKTVIQYQLIPMLSSNNVKYNVIEKSPFICVNIER